LRLDLYVATSTYQRFFDRRHRCALPRASQCLTYVVLTSRPWSGYDVYDLYDLGEFDQKGAVRTGWGTKEEFIDLIKHGKELGIISYMWASFYCMAIVLLVNLNISYSDAVLNHRLGADESETFKATEVSNDDRTKNLGEPYDIEGWTK
jgi:alpha-amylase